MTDSIRRLPEGDLGDHGLPVRHGDHLHCPVCLDPLERDEAGALRCDECGWTLAPAPASAEQ